MMYIFSHYFMKIKVHSYDSLPTEKLLSSHNAVIPTKSFLIKIKVTTTIRYFYKTTHVNQLKNNVFFYSIIMVRQKKQKKSFMLKTNL